jgi:hypothetical protein
MQATQQQTFKEPRTALAAVVLAVAFSTGTVLGLAIGISGPKFGPATAAAPARVGDRSYDAIEEGRAASGALIVAGDRSYDAVEAARAGGAKTSSGGDRSYRGILDERTNGAVTAPASKTFRDPRSHGPLEFD